LPLRYFGGAPIAGSNVHQEGALGNRLETEFYAAAFDAAKSALRSLRLRKNS
jgi:hypothetical protein